MVDNNRISDAELLKFCAENAIIDLAIVAQKYEMANRQRYLDMHTGKIWLASDGYWKTKLPKGDDGLRLVKKKNRSDIEDAIIEYYKSQSDDYTFKGRFDVWVERQRICNRSDNTILKYQSDYKRFFENYPFEKIDIRNIDEEILSEHILMILSEKEIRWRAFKDIIGYVNGVFTKAIKDRIINDNPCNYLDLETYKRYCYMPPVKTTVERTLTDNDIHTLLERVRHPRAYNANRISCFAIEMSLNTGMRVGELAALKWEDIIKDEGIILIRHSERYNRTTKKSEISTTKTGKERIFPLTDEIMDLLNRIREYESDHGWLGEYVFRDANGRLTKSKISDAIRNHTSSSDYSGVKSIHAIRRTFNSKMRCSGVSSTVASDLLGHSERVNESNYTYDILNLNEKRAIVTQIVTKVTQF